jgi:hypothetical protein
MEVTLFIWSYCRDMKKSSLHPGTLNRGFTVIMQFSDPILYIISISVNYILNLLYITLTSFAPSACFKVMTSIHTHTHTYQIACVHFTVPEHDSCHKMSQQM